VPEVDAALTSLVGCGGLLVGAVLDPVSQRLAERSRVDEEARRRESEVTSDDGPGDVPGDPAAPGPPSGPPDEKQPALRHLVPAGRSVPRTVAAAVLTGALWAGAAARFGGHVALGAFLACFAVLAAVALTDLSTRLVPRRLVYPGAALMVAFFVAAAPVDHTAGHLPGAGIAGAAAFSAFFAVWWFVPRGMGFGDVRLAGFIGIATGWLSLLHAYVAFLAGFVAGLAFGVASIAASGGGRRTRIPFAPALALGAVIGVFWGGPIARAVFGPAV
jgi:leader peptidase (prepilin peptidase)/N-methyltransferase